jgi:nucleotide-binding universal stress UspA family protein
MSGLVVIGYDGSPDAAHAVDFAAARLGARAAVVVNVWATSLPAVEIDRPLGALPAPSLEQDAGLERAALETAEQGAARARAAGLAAEPEIRRGTGAGQIASCLLDVADERDADLLVVGHRGMGRIRTAVLGSVAEAAVREARRPVLVVPAPDA